MANKITYQVGFTADTTQLKAALNGVTAQLDKLGSSSNNRLDRELRDAADSALRLSSHLRAAFNQNTGKLDLVTFQNQLKQSGRTLQDYARDLSRLGPQGQEAFLKTARAIMTAEVPLKRVGKLLDNLWVTMKNTARWQISQTALNAFTSTLQTAYGYAQDLNESLNNIRIVSSKSVEEMDRFAEKANKAAKALSATTLDYTNAALIYYQQGLDDSQIEARTAVTLKMAEVSRQSAEEVSDQLTAIWNNFYDGSKSLEYYGDVITALGAKTASSSEEIATGLEKFAAISDTVGLSYEYATAALATVTATTRQSAEIVGTAFKTIFARMQGLKLGETLDDGTSLNKYSEALQSVGISIFEQNGELKEMDKILNEMGSKWDTLSKAQQTALAQTVGGARQYNQIVALMDNWDFMQENLSTVGASTGALSKQQEIYAESWEAASDRVRAAAEDIYTSLMNDDFFIDLLNGTEKFLNGLDNVIDGLGGLDGILLTVYAAMTRLYGPQMAQGLQNIVQTVGGLLGLEERKANALRGEAASLASNIQVMTTQTSIEIDFAKRKMELQEIINRNAKNYSAEMQTTIALQQRELELLEQQTLELNKKAQASKDNVFNLEGDLYERMAPIDEENFNIQDYEDELETSISRFNQGKKQREFKFDQSEFSRIANDSSLSDEQKYSNLLAELISQTKQYYAELQKRKNIEAEIRKITADGSVTAANQAEIEAILKRNGLLKESANQLSTVQGRVREVFNSLSPQDMGRVSVQLQEMFTTFGIGRDQARNFIAELQKMYSAEQLASMSTEDLRQAFEQMQGTLQSPTAQFKNWSEVVVSVTGALSQLNVAFQSIQNVGRVFSDEDATAGQQLTAVLTALSMVIPAVLSAKTALMTLSKAFIVVEGQEVAVKGASIGATLAQAVASKILAGAKEGEASATRKATAAALGGMVAILPYIAAVGALVAVIYLLVKAYNKDADAAKHAAEAAKQTAQAADEAKNAADKLRSSIEAYDSAVEKLEACTKGTQEWRDALKEVNKVAIDVLNNSGKLTAEEIKGLRNEDGTLNREALGELQQKADQRADNLAFASAAADKYAADMQTRSTAMNLGRQVTGSAKLYGRRTAVDTIDQTVLLNNYEELAKLSKQDLIPALQDLGFVLDENNVAIQDKWFNAIQGMASEAEAAAEKFNLIAQMKVEEVLGTPEETDLLGQAINKLTTNNVDEYTQQRVDYWEDRLTGSGINKASGSNNTIYQDTLQALKDAGYDLSAQTNNAVRGTDNNRSLAFLNSEGTEVVYNAEQIAAMIGAAEAIGNIAEASENARAALANLDEDALGYIASGGFSKSTSSGLENYLNAEDAMASFGGEDAIKSIIAAQENIELSAVTDGMVDEFVSSVVASAEGAQERINSVGADYAKSVQAAIEDVGLKESDLSVGEMEEVADIFALASAHGKLAEAVAAYQAGTLEEFSEELNATIEGLSSFASKYGEIHKIIDGLENGDTISAEDYEKLGEENQQYFTMMLDGTYKLTESAAKFKETVQDQLLTEAFENKDRLTAKNQELANLQGYDFNNLTQDANYQGEDGIWHFDTATVQQQLDILRLLGDQSAEALGQVQAWQEELDSGHFEDGADLAVIAEKVAECNSAFQGLSDQVEANEAEIRNWDLAIASSFDNLEDLKEALDKDQIGIDAFNQAWLNLDKASDTEMLDAEEWEDFSDYLQRSAKEMESLNDEMSEDEARIVAKSIMKMNDGVEELAENFEEWSDVLEESSESSEEYSDALKGTRSALSKLLDTSEDYISNDFITEHLDLIKKASTGSAEAIDELKNILANDIVAKIVVDNGLSEEAAATLLTDFQNLQTQMPDIEVGASLNDGDFLANAQKLISDAGMTVDQVNALFDAMGFEANFKTEEKDVVQQVPQYVTQTEILETDESGYPTKTKTYTYQDGTFSAEGKMVVPAMSTNGKTPIIESITAKPGGNYNNFSSNNRGGKSPGGGGSKKAEKKDPAKTNLRYRKIDRAIDSTSRSLDKLDTQAERTFGTDKIPLLNKGLEELNKQAELYTQRLEEANTYLAEDLAAIKELGLTPIVDPATKEIANYDELVKAIDAAYNAEIEKYNKMSAAQQEQHKERMDDLKEEHDKQIEALEQYVETLDEYNDTQDRIEEARRAAWDKSLEIATKELEIALKIKDLRQSIRDIDRQIAESTGDYLDHGQKVLELENARYEDALALKGVLESTVANLHSIANDPYADTEALNEALMDVADNAITSAEDMLEFLEVIKTHLPNAVEAARERLDYFFETFDHNESVAESVKELMALQGVSYKTADGLAKLQKAATAQMNTQRAAMATNKQWYDSLVPRVAEAEAELAKYQVGTAGYDVAKGALDALLAEMREAETAMLDSAQRTMETARVMYETQVDALLYSLEQKLTNGTGFELLQAKYDHLISANDRYLDEVNKIYQVEDLNRKIQADIDKSQGQYSISKLKGLQDELALMNKRNDVSAYELEIMNAKYAMLQAQIALEEAQNAKSEVRLMRDSSGNWNYQFTANQDAINTAQANYDKAVNDYYNIAKDYAKSTSADILAIQEEMMDELREIWTNEELTEQERRARMLEVQEYYFNQARYLYDEQKKAVQDTGEAGKLAIVDFENQFALSLEGMTGDFNTFETEGKLTISEMETAFNDYQSTIDSVARESGLDLDSLKKKIDEVELSTRAAEKAADDMVDKLSTRLAAIQEETNYWAGLADEIRRAAQERADYARGLANEVESNSGATTFNKGYVDGVDYQAMMNTYLLNGGSKDSEAYRELESQRNAKIDDLRADGVDSSYWETNTGEFYNHNEYIEKMKKAGIPGFATGGFTGAWGDYGKLAFLHEKELVLNKEDTENILSAVNLVRDIGPALFQSIAQTLDKEAAASQFLMGARLNAPSAAAANEKLVQQVVSIDATFPGVQSANEIEIALTNLVNEAAQRAATGPF